MAMVSALWLGVSLLAAADGTGTGTAADRKPAAPAAAPDLKAYQAARDALGRGSDAHVKLALWCEAHGLSAERVKHLALAVLTDPKNAAARGLMGLVDYHGRWESPEIVSDQVKADEALTAKLAAYNTRRAALAGTAEDHWKLAQWCEVNGLDAEARAHYVTVTRLDPSREAAWKRLGLKKVGGRWVSDAQLAQEQAETSAQKKADTHWKPLLLKWHGWLHDHGPKKRADAQAALDRLDDPRAVPLLWAVFATGDATDQGAVVPVLARLDGPAAGRALAMIAVFGKTPAVSRAAAETLRLRDGRDFIGLLVEMVRKPLKYEIRPTNGPALPGELYIEGAKADVRRVYLQAPDLQRAIAQIPPRIFDASVPFDPYGDRNLILAGGNVMGTGLGATPQGVLTAVSAVPPTRHGPSTAPVNVDVVAARRDREIARRIERIQTSIDASRQQLLNDVATVETMNAGANQVNGQVLPVLKVVTEQDLGASPDDWKAWWADQRGYVYEPPPTESTKPVLTQYVPNPVTAGAHHSCFAAGTPVRTIEGPRPIEAIKVGDRVLAQDVATGRLQYTPVVAAFHNKPAVTYKVVAGDETVSCTAIHRFWKTGHGWVMARDLKTGDLLRTIGGNARVATVETDRTQPVFNLEVGAGTSYFVGHSGLLVHDNSTVWPVSHPFDAPPDLAIAGERGRAE
jgi:Pretoxin HINT domain